MTDFDAVVMEAQEALGHGRPLAGAARVVPDQPRLYAICGDAKTWTALQLGKPPDERPLYIGKAEDSLVARDLKTHFGDGRTGVDRPPLVRGAAAGHARSARCTAQRGQSGVLPRAAGLVCAHDSELTRWMKERLQLAVWSKPAECEFTLRAIKSALLTALLPPLNLRGVVTPWTTKVKAARAVMAEEARTWSVTTVSGDA